uniref:Glycosyltransferase n=1 Tax=Linum usitatissimum TaxID=4006 RepID=I2BHA0_LINUS|nr:UDP-glycosyltransferase 1 [Linum usitatissimum]
MSEVKQHAVLLPLPAQGHVNPFMQLAKLLHSKGFHITFVNTEYNHRRLIRTRGPEAVKGLSDFQFHTIPDGLPPSDKDATQDPLSLCYSIQHDCLQPFLELLNKLNTSPQIPPVSCIVSDGCMTFGIKAAELLGITQATFWTASACSFMGSLQFEQLVRRGISPLKEANLTDGTLDLHLDWIPGMSNIRLKDLPSFATTTDAEDVMFKFAEIEIENCLKSGAIIFNTFDALEEQVLSAIKMDYYPQPIYTVGPLHLLGKEMLEPATESNSISSNLWKEDLGCMEWLGQREPNSVVYVNYGSVTVMSDENLKEFAWGLANCERPFLWIVRGDVVMGDSGFLPLDFLDEVKDRGFLASWCLQQEVLSHPSVGVFLTHCGWNSMMESLSVGVPMICWPVFGDQQTNCRYACSEWRVGVELSRDVKRNEVTKVIQSVMLEENWKMMKQKSVEWKTRAKDAVSEQGSSFNNFTRFFQDHLQYQS